MAAGTRMRSNKEIPAVVAALSLVKVKANPFAGDQAGFLMGAWSCKQHLPYKIRADRSSPDHLVQMLASLMDATSTVADGLRYQYMLSQNRLPEFVDGLRKLWPQDLLELGEDTSMVSKLSDMLQKHHVPITSAADVTASNRNYSSLTWGLKSNAKAFSALGAKQNKKSRCRKRFRSGIKKLAFRLRLPVYSATST